MRISCKICRRVGESVCGREKCAFKKKPYPPGIFGRKKGRHSSRGISEYGMQLKEKQKIRFTYGIRSGQLEKYLKEGDDIFSVLESRLDNVIYRMGLAQNRSQARQIVSHGHILVDGRRVNIPSYLVKIGQKISVKPSSFNKSLFKDLDFKLKNYNPPSWLKLDKEKKEAEIIGRPTK